MKKIISFLLVFTLGLVTVGCSKGTSVQKTVESNGQNKNKTQESSANIQDSKALYEFVKGKYTFKDFEEFNSNVDVTMLDVTGDGIDEAILVKNSSRNPIVFISVDNGKFEIIPSNVESGQYTTNITHSAKFILIKGTGGGSGVRVEYLDLAYYTGKEIKLALGKLFTEYNSGGPGELWEGEGQINFADDNHNYENFNYHYNLFVNEEHMQDIRQNYKFNKSTGTFKITPIDGGFDKLKDSNNKPNNQYSTTTKKAVTNDSSLTNDDSVNQTTEDIEAIEGESFKLKGFTSETINGENIDYSQYTAVIVPMHSTSNIASLTRKTCSFSDNPSNSKVTFSVFGEMKDIKVTYFGNMDSKGEVENVDILKNSYLDIYAPFDTDMSYVKITGKINIGEGCFTDVEFTMDTVRFIDEYKIYKYE